MQGFKPILVSGFCCSNLEPRELMKIALQGKCWSRMMALCKKQKSLLVLVLYSLMVSRTIRFNSNPSLNLVHCGNRLLLHPLAGEKTSISVQVHHKTLE